MEKMEKFRPKMVITQSFEQKLKLRRDELMCFAEIKNVLIVYNHFWASGLHDSMRLLTF